jgi:hypothetical protein
VWASTTAARSGPKRLRFMAAKTSLLSICGPLRLQGGYLNEEGRTCFDVEGGWVSPRASQWLLEMHSGGGVLQPQDLESRTLAQFEGGVRETPSSDSSRGRLAASGKPGARWLRRGAS